MKRDPLLRRAVLAGLAALLVAGCGMGRWFGAEAPDGTVSGTIAWRDPIALPPGATLVVKLEAVSRPGAPPVLIAEQTIEGREREPPLAFELRYKGEVINPEREYFVSAEVLLLERPMFASPAPHPVLTRGRASRGLRILLTRPGRAAGDGG
ncbi:MAG TPA: YbaY family lipoprotein [Burkholderiales bacterium]